MSLRDSACVGDGAATQSATVKREVLLFAEDFDVGLRARALTERSPINKMGLAPSAGPGRL